METDPADWKDAESQPSLQEHVTKLRRSFRNRESHDELASLESELRRAYAAKELQAQLAEREVERYADCLRRRRTADEMRLREQAALELDTRRRSEAHERSLDYRRHLEQQMSRKKEEQRLSEQKARVEREVLQEVDRMREENERTRALEKKHELVESSRREFQVHQEIKAIQRQRDEEQEARRCIQDEKYSLEVEQRAKKVRELREQQAARRESILREIADVIMRAEILKREREALITELVARDVKCELVIREEEEKQRRRKLREELAAGLEEQMVFTEQCKLRFVEQDRAFAEEIMKKIMEDERTERLTSQAKKRLQLQYREDLDKLIEDRRRIRDEEIARIEDSAREEERREENRLEEIKEARKRLLEEHAPNIGAFVNTAALAPDERAIIAESIRSKCGSQLDANSIVTDTS